MLYDCAGCFNDFRNFTVLMHIQANNPVVEIVQNIKKNGSENIFTKTLEKGLTFCLHCDKMIHVLRNNNKEQNNMRL